MPASAQNTSASVAGNGPPAPSTTTSSPCRSTATPRLRRPPANAFASSASRAPRSTDRPVARPASSSARLVTLLEPGTRTRASRPGRAGRMLRGVLARAEVIARMISQGLLQAARHVLRQGIDLAGWQLVGERRHGAAAVLDLGLDLGEIVLAVDGRGAAAAAVGAVAAGSSCPRRARRPRRWRVRPACSSRRASCHRSGCLRRDGCGAAARRRTNRRRRRPRSRAGLPAPRSGSSVPCRLLSWGVEWARDSPAVATTTASGPGRVSGRSVGQPASRREYSS